MLFYLNLNIKYWYLLSCHFLPRVHELEEQMRDAETRADQSLEDETRRHREVYSKMKKDKNQKFDMLHNR